MKLAKDEVYRVGDADPLDLFIRGIKSEATREKCFLIKRGIHKKASYKVITQLLNKMAIRAGLRGEKAKDARRFDVPLMNGFRRFWNKTYKKTLYQDSPLASLIKKGVHDGPQEAGAA